MSDFPLLIRPNAIENFVGLPLRTAQKKAADPDDDFPAAVQTGPRSVAWLVDELLAWLEALRQKRDERIASGLPPVSILSPNPRAADLPKRPRGRPRKNPLPPEEQTTAG